MPPLSLGHGWDLYNKIFHYLHNLAWSMVYAKWPVYLAALDRTDTPASDHIPDEIVGLLEDFPQYFEFNDQKHLLYKWVASPRHLELIQGMENDNMN